MNKREDLRVLTDMDDYHFVFITESWLHDYIIIIYYEIVQEVQHIYKI